MTKNLLIRCDAGVSFGLGHLSRCISLADEFGPDITVFYLIKTDDKEKIRAFFGEKSLKNKIDDVQFLDQNIEEREDLEILIEFCNSKNAFLILDHYSISWDYQRTLREKGIKWLQFDSHGKDNFLADFVLHASPAASIEQYKALSKNPDTTFLLGTKYAIINKKFRKKRHQISERTQLRNILICFGGGDDKGTTLKVLKSLDRETINGLTFKVIISQKNNNKEEIKSIAESFDNIELFFDVTDIQEFMAEADLAIISPGTLSYEACSLGLPMILIPFADNQLMNAKGWEDINCAESLDSIENINAYSLQNIFDTIEIEELSANCLKYVDGRGAERVMKEITKEFNSFN